MPRLSRSNNETVIFDLPYGYRGTGKLLKVNDLTAVIDFQGLKITKLLGAENVWILEEGQAPVELLPLGLRRVIA